MRNDLHFSTGRNVTATPSPTIDMFVARYTGGRPFTTDIAALASNAKAPQYVGPDHVDPARRDCLTISWPRACDGELIFLNPPYGRTENACKHTVVDGQVLSFAPCVKKRCEKRGWHTAVRIPGCELFVKKAVEEARLGSEVFALLAARTDTGWFHDYLWDHDARTWRPGVEGWFLPDRIAFIRAEGSDDSAPFPSLLVRLFQP